MDIEGKDPILNELARRLRMARAALGLTQADAAGAAGISQSALSLYERGRREPLATSVARLAAVYGTTADWLLGLGAGAAPPSRPDGPASGHGGRLAPTG